MNSARLWFLGVIVVWPMQFIVGWFADRPIKLAPTDVLFITIPIAYLCFRFERPSSKTNFSSTAILRDVLAPVLALLCVVYASGLAVIGYESSGEVTRLLSAIRFILPIGFVLIGLILGATMVSPFDFIDVLSRSHGAIIALALVSTLANPNIQLGEWGRYICGVEITGYPNTAMSFFAAMAPLVLASADAAKHRSMKLIGWGLAAGSALMIVGSMSRSSVMVLFIGTAIYFALTSRWKFLAASTAVFAILSAIGLGLLTVPTNWNPRQSPANHVADQTEQRGETTDPSNGRFEIWQFTLELASERPIFGYMFEPFVHFVGDIEDPHQQYLEILYKCGGVGLALYMGLLLSSSLLILRRWRMTHRGTRPWNHLCGATGMLFAILLGSLTQSNLGHFLTGNMAFLLIGVLSHPNAALLASQDGQASNRPVCNGEQVQSIAA